jgi:transcriptional regulator with XRE-family HTH domain
MHFGERIKELRESKGLLQRQVAASLDMDTPNFSKIERGERKAKREQVSLLAKMLDENEEDLFTLWLADKVFDVVKDEDLGLKAMQVAEKEIKYRLKIKRK